MAEIGGISRAGAGAMMRSRAALGSAFAIPAEPPATAPGGASGAMAPAVSLSGLLALHEAEPEAPRDRSARRRGQDLLAALAELQRELLVGDGGETLVRLACLTENLPQAADPRLDAVLGAVALRARIELARRGLDTRPIRETAGQKRE